jgi:hypothetical protein
MSSTIRFRGAGDSLEEDMTWKRELAAEIYRCEYRKWV